MEGRPVAAPGVVMFNCVASNVDDVSGAVALCVFGMTGTVGCPANNVRPLHRF